MSTIRVQAPDGTTGFLDDAGNFTPDARAEPKPGHGVNLDPAQDVEGEDDQIQGPGNGPAALVAKFNDTVARKHGHEIAAFGINSVPFGLGPKLAGISARVAHPNTLSNTITGNPYTAPDAQQKFSEAARELSEENPKAALAGKGVALAGELAAGSAAEGAVAAGAGKLLPGVASRLVRAKETAPVLTSALKSGIEGAGYGAAGAAGDAASGDQDVFEAAEGGAKVGGIGGAALGAVAGKLGKLFKGAPQGYQDEFAREFIGSSIKKDKKAFVNILNKTAETNVPEHAADEFLQSADLRPVRDALLDKNYGGAQSEIKALKRPLLAERAADYADIDRVSGGVEVGKPFEELRKDLYAAVNSTKKDPVAADALSKELTRFKESYSSAPTATVKDILDRQASMHAPESPLGQQFKAVADALPDVPRATRSSIFEASKNASPEVREFLDKRVLDPQTGILTWDPSAKIPTVEYRGAVSAAQKNAVTAIGTLNPTDAGLRKVAVKVPLNRALESHLDSVAANGPDLQRAVDATRNRDVKLSLLAAIEQGIGAREANEATSRFQAPLHERIGQSSGAHVLGAIPGGTAAFHDAREGHLERLPGDLAFAAAGAVAPRLLTKAGGKAVSAIRAAATNGGGTLQAVREAAESGNVRAKSLLARIAARAGAGVGATVSSTLGAGQ